MKIPCRAFKASRLRLVILLMPVLLAACAPSVKPQTFGQMPASPPAYDYPIENPYAATIITVPPAMQVDYSSMPIPQDRRITLFGDRRIPEGFWYQRGLEYAQLLQPKPAPLVYVIAGTGADSRSGTMRTLADILYSGGFNVVLLPSPTHANFIINASANFLPGRPSQDAADLYRAMKAIDPLVRKEAGVTGHMLIGYSLGAVDAAFTARLDDDRHALNFSKVLLINPPYNLYQSMKRVDGYLYRALPGGIKDADNFIKGALRRLSTVSQSSDALEFASERLLLDAYDKYQPSDDRLATTIGLSFRLAAVNMITTSDIMSRSGYIFPKDREFKTSTPMNDYLGIALRTSLTDYFDQIYTERYKGLNPGLTSEQLLDEGRLDRLKAYIQDSGKMYLITNKDDIILAPGDAARLAAIFGSHATIFPNGGHLGNLAHPAVAYRIVQDLKAGAP